MAFDITKMSRSLKEWMRLHDAKYEEHLENLRNALMYRWRGVAYFRCYHCKQYNNNQDNNGFHIVPVSHVNEKFEIHKKTLETVCDSCNRFFTDDGEAEIRE